VPLDFLRRGGRGRPEPDGSIPGAPRPVAASLQLVTDEPEAEEYELKLTYRAKSSHGVRMAGGAQPIGRLPSLIADLARTTPELVQPLDFEYQEAAPLIARTIEASQWLHAHHERSPITRHSLMVLESLDAIDPAFESMALALFSGEVDTRGFPEYDAIIGGVVSHWDEVTGDQILRGIVGWGGRGVRGDTERNAIRTLAGLLGNILASQDAVGIVEFERPVPAEGGGGLICAHCQFTSAHERAFFCPKCGMRMLRG
jgi:hypothetical protein